MNKHLFIGLLLPSLLCTTLTKTSGSDIEPTVAKTETTEKKTEPKPSQNVTEKDSKEKESDDYWDDFDSFFDTDFPRFEFPRASWKKSPRMIQEKEIVSLPDVEVKRDEDKKAVLLMIKGLQCKKEEIAIELYEDKGYALITFPYNEANITMKLWNDEFAMSGIKTIIQEKKDEKGKVLSSSSYKSSNSLARTLPKKIHLNALKTSHPQYKDGVLTFTFALKELKETITVE